MKRECFEQIFISKKNISHEIENYSLSKDPKFSRSKIFKRKFYTSSKTFFLSNRKSNKTIVKKTPKSLRFITRQIKLVRIQKFSRSKRKINSSIPQIVYTILYIFLSKTDSSNSPQNKIDKTPLFFFYRIEDRTREWEKARRMRRGKHGCDGRRNMAGRLAMAKRRVLVTEFLFACVYISLCFEESSRSNGHRSPLEYRLEAQHVEPRFY